jgi:uncharacterized protein (DUF362 family)
MPPVSLAYSSCYSEIYPDLSRAIDLAGGIPLQSGSAVAIKINMCDARPENTGTITPPLFLDAVLRYLRSHHGALDIFVVESDATVVLADEFIRWFGYLPIIEKWGAKWWNLSKDEIVERNSAALHYLKPVPVPKLLTRASLVSVAKLKTNSVSKITAILKNQFGCLPMVQKSVFHDHIAEVIVDANLAMKPIFSIVDGVLAMGGPCGPAWGVPIRAGVVVAGRDPVAVDSVCATVVGIRPKSIAHVRLAERSGLGSSRFQLVGDEMPKVDFELDAMADLQFSLAQAIKRLQRGSARLRWRRA